MKGRPREGGRSSQERLKRGVQAWNTQWEEGGAMEVVSGRTWTWTVCISTMMHPRDGKEQGR
jgi:hypothetical protein